MTEKRRAQNRDAQRNLRARRQAEAGEHRERVCHLERENSELRALIDALRDENTQLRGQIPLSALPAHLLEALAPAAPPSFSGSSICDFSSHSEDEAHHFSMYDSPAEHSD